MCKGNNVTVLEKDHGSFDCGESRENGVKFLLGWLQGMWERKEKLVFWA